MNVDYEIVEGVASLIVAGELDLSSAGRLQDLGEVALAEIVSTVRIDLAGVLFIDSTGLGALMAIKNKADRGRQVLIIERPSERVTRALELAGLANHFRID